MDFAHYRKLAKRHDAPIVLVAHKMTPGVLSMMGGKLPASYEAAREAAEQMIASGNFVKSAIVKPTGEVMVRIPGLNGVYAEDTQA